MFNTMLLHLHIVPKYAEPFHYQSHLLRPLGKPSIYKNEANMSHLILILLSILLPWLIKISHLNREQKWRLEAYYIHIPNFVQQLQLPCVIFCMEIRDSMLFLCLMH